MTSTKNTFTSALPALKPALVIDTKTGETINDWNSSVQQLLQHVYNETLTEYQLHTKNIQQVASTLKFAPAEHARKHQIYNQIAYRITPRNQSEIAYSTFNSP